jgi:carbon-monoxide dehydrogenase iron sulfur subunit
MGRPVGCRSGTQRNVIKLDVTKCSGCRRCEVNCSFFHTGEVGRSRSRIKVVKIESRGIDVPVVCQQCLERYCARCPESAIAIGERGEIVVSRDRCTACGTCERLCPIGAIELLDGIPLVCDLCGGDPSCVRECNLGAVTFEPTIMGVVALGSLRKKTRKLSPEAKRVRFAEALTEDMRKEWGGRRRT